MKYISSRDNNVKTKIVAVTGNGGGSGPYSFNDATLDAESSYLKAAWKLNSNGDDCIGDNDLIATSVSFSTTGIEDGKNCAEFDGVSSYMTAPSGNTDLDIGAGTVTSGEVASRKINMFVSCGPASTYAYNANLSLDAQSIYWSYDGVKWDCANMNDPQDGMGHDNWHLEHPNPDSGGTHGLDYHTPYAYGTCICYGNGVFVAGGYQQPGGGNCLAYSYDGKQWHNCTPYSTFSNGFVTAIAFNGTRFVAVGDGQGSEGMVATSEDGIVWTIRATSLFSYDGCSTICWDGTNFIVGRNYGGGDIVYSSDGITWSSIVNVISFDGTANIKCVVANENVVIAAINGSDWGYSGTWPAKLKYSLDHGATWSNCIGGEFGVLAMCWGDNKFIACAGSIVMSSSDGITWSKIAAIPNIMTSIRSICWNGEKYVITGLGSNTHAYSFDGIKWIGCGLIYNGPDNVGVGPGVCSTIAPKLIPAQIGIDSIEENTMDSQYNFTVDYWVKPQSVSENRYIAVGGNTTDKNVMWSSDAVNWTQVLNTNGGVVNTKDVCFGNNQYIMINLDTGIYGSTDGGLTWSYRERARYGYPGYGWYGECNGIIYSGAKFICTGGFDFDTNSYSYANCFLTSNNGYNWTPCGGTIFDMAGGCHLAYDGTTYVAVGNGNSHTVATSTNGTDWTGRGQPWYPSMSGGVTAKVCYGEGTFVISRILGFDDQGYCFAYSTNSGVSWTACGFYNDQWGDPAYTSAAYGIAYDGTQFVAVGVFGYQTHMDWETYETIVDNPGYSVATSPDGINWTGLTNSRTNIFSEGRSICWDGTQFIANGNGLQVATSTNGTDWTVVATPATAVKTAICCNPAPQIVPSVPQYDAPNTKTILSTSDTDKYIALYSNKSDNNKLPTVSIAHNTTKGIKIGNYVSENSILTNDWHHLAFVKTGITLKCYIDGELSITATYDPFEGIGNWTIGKNKDNVFSKMNLEEYHVWKGKALSEAEITRLYNDGVGRFLGPPTTVNKKYVYVRTQ